MRYVFRNIPCFLTYVGRGWSIVGRGLSLGGQLNLIACTRMVGRVVRVIEVVHGLAHGPKWFRDKAASGAILKKEIHLFEFLWGSHM